ncbi:MAG: hypothetical protein I3J02_08120 [Prevotella sp.]|nr:hypothetical protein [Prevotella sp.]
MMPHKRISTFILRSIVFSLVVFSMPQAYAQTSKKEAQEKLRLKQIDDSIPWFRGIQVKADLVGLVQKLVSDYGQYEAGVRVNLKDKYFPTIELGLGKADHNDIVTQISYKTSAPYGKIGADFNIMKNKHDIYRVYVGFRYGYTSFKFDVDHPDMIDPVWGGTTPFTGHNIKANYHWMELLASIDAKIWGPVHMGWSARYKRRLHYNNGELGNVWYVPGFGKQGSTRLGGTFDIIIEL